MIDIGMTCAMAALPLAEADGSGSAGLLIGVAVVSFAIGAVVFSLIFRRKVAIDSNLAENARKEAEAIKAEAEKEGGSGKHPVLQRSYPQRHDREVAWRQNAVQ